jgi:hypothetical protein
MAWQPQAAGPFSFPKQLDTDLENPDYSRGAGSARRHNTGTTAMRQALSFACAAALLAGGLFLLVMEFVYAARWFGALVMGAGFMIAVGGYWLWIDFLARPARAGRQPR